MQMNIKLRAWNELSEGGEMVTEENSGLKSWQILERFSEVMLCTGCKDRHGNDIYEGDIFRALNGKHLVVVYVRNSFTVRYLNGRLVYPLTLALANGSSVVIGNIHENPELL